MAENYRFETLQLHAGHEIDETHVITSYSIHYTKLYEEHY